MLLVGVVERFSGTPIDFALYVYLLLGFVLYASFRAWRDERKAVETLKRGGELSFPNLILDKFHETTRYVGTDGQFTNPISCLHAGFLNRPGKPTDKSEAHNITARISYFHRESDLPVLSQLGRWGDSDQPSGQMLGRSSIELVCAEFPIGVTRELNLAIKYPEDEECYAFNNDSYGSPGLKKPNQKLSGDHFKLVVELNGPFVKRSWWLEFENGGRGKGLKAGKWEELLTED